MKYIKLFEEFILLEAFSEKFINSTVDKLSKENPKVDPSLIKSYVLLFDKFKDSKHITEKDITKYAWAQLKMALDSKPNSRIKTGKVSVDNAEEIYKKGTIRIYCAMDMKSSIKYGNGYSWCISARSSGNLFTNYRLMTQGTTYFIFDDSKTTDKNEDGFFVDPTHVIVFMPRVSGNDKDEIFAVADADNKGDTEFKTYEQAEKEYPVLSGLKDTLVRVPLSDEEAKMKVAYKNFFDQVRDVQNYHKEKYHYSYDNGLPSISISDYYNIQKAATGELDVEYVTCKTDYENYSTIVFYKGDDTEALTDWADEMEAKEEIEAEPGDFDIDFFETEPLSKKNIKDLVNVVMLYKDLYEFNKASMYNK